MATSSSTKSALIAIAAADPSPAAVMTWARGLAALPATPDVRDAGTADGVGDDPSPIVHRAAQGDQHIVVWQEPRPDEDCGAADDATVLQLDATKAIMVNEKPSYDAIHNADGTG